ncbi:MAG: VOC family protein [Polyangiaceae bacterium]|nr:VOC family protein [Polyangiaceae bacterium]
MDKSESTSHIATGSKVSIVRSQRLSHGTLLCANLTRSRKFYEEFLGLEVVRHAASAMMFRLHTGMHVVCVECGPEKLWDMHVLHHWGIDVYSQEAVDEAHQNAISYKDHYGMQKIMKPVLQHGAYSFYLQDLDRNWWEIQCSTLDHAAYFARGDVMTP